MSSLWPQCLFFTLTSSTGKLPKSKSIAELSNSIHAVVFHTYHWGISTNRKRVIGRNYLFIQAPRKMMEGKCMGEALCSLP